MKLNISYEVIASLDTLSFYGFIPDHKFGRVEVDVV